MKQVNVALLGLGTVGTGVWKMISANQEYIAKRSGAFFDIKGILIRNGNKRRGLPGIEPLLTDQFETLFSDRIDVIIEAMGGIEPALSYVKEAIARGCHIVTANKELIARHGVELNQLAKEQGVQILFEASVGGGIPVLGTLQHFLKANRIHKVLGIVNGTTNFILTEMEVGKRGFADVLSEAQEKGYAEADPSADVDGWDAVHKLVILIRIVFGINVHVENIPVQGIRDVTLSEIELAHLLGYKIKLISQAEQVDGQAVRASVQPMLLPQSHPLSSIQGVYNAVYVEGDQVQDVTLVGQGAGEQPTASAVVEDLTNIYRLPPQVDDIPTQSLQVEDNQESEQFVALTLTEVLTETEQQEWIRTLEREHGCQVKKWVSQCEQQATAFGLIVDHWKRKPVALDQVKQIKVRSILK